MTEFTQTLKIEKRNNLNSEKSTKWQQRIKIIAILCLNKGSCVFATSEFPAEIPRTQTRNYSYTKPLCQINPKSGIPYYYIGLSYQKIGDKDFDLILEAFQNALLLELDDNTRKKTQSLLEATKKREKRLKDFWH